MSIEDNNPLRNKLWSFGGGRFGDRPKDADARSQIAAKIQPGAGSDKEENGTIVIGQSEMGQIPSLGEDGDQPTATAEVDVNVRNWIGC
jgi:hypothetical protein